MKVCSYILIFIWVIFGLSVWALWVYIPRKKSHTAWKRRAERENQSAGHLWSSSLRSRVSSSTIHEGILRKLRIDFRKVTHLFFFFKSSLYNTKFLSGWPEF